MSDILKRSIGRPKSFNCQEELKEQINEYIRIWESQGRPLTVVGLALYLGVSRETLARLEDYADLLRKWQNAINLVSTASLNDLWRRHIWDSAQLLPHIPADAHSLLDLGSGAGFPGLVLAILGVDGVVLVEADKRKCAFLREAARVTGTDVTIHDRRIEDMGEEIPPVDVITARAVASLSLLSLSHRAAGGGGIGGNSADLAGCDRKNSERYRCRRCHNSVEG